MVPAYATWQHIPPIEAIVPTHPCTIKTMDISICNQDEHVLKIFGLMIMIGLSAAIGFWVRRSFERNPLAATAGAAVAFARLGGTELQAHLDALLRAFQTHFTLSSDEADEMLHQGIRLSKSYLGAGPALARLSHCLHRHHPQHLRKLCTILDSSIHDCNTDLSPAQEAALEEISKLCDLP